MAHTDKNYGGKFECESARAVFGVGTWHFQYSGQGNPHLKGGFLAKT